MIANDGKTPILMDFGSTMKARINIENRSQALMQQVWTHILSLYRLFLFFLSVSSSQDIAAEQSTMSYRAPELFDVKTGQTIDERVDIWVCIPSNPFPSFFLKLALSLSTI